MILKRDQVCRISAEGSNNSGTWSSDYSQSSSGAEPVLLARDLSSMIIMTGCPLLLTGMCVERYVAVVRPVFYLKSRTLQHRLALSAAVWCITSVFCVAIGESWTHHTVAL